MQLGEFRLVVAMLSNPGRAVDATLLRRLAVLEMVSALCISGSSFALPPIEGPLRDGIGVLDVRLIGLVMVLLSNPDLIILSTVTWLRNRASNASPSWLEIGGSTCG